MLDEEEHVRHPGRIAIRVEYQDDDLIELKTDVRIRDWYGVGRSYASSIELGKQASGLEQWSRNPEQEFIVGSGTENGIGCLLLRFYTVDMAGHTFCHVTMATMSPTRVGEGLWTLVLSFPTEPALIERFSKELSLLASTQKGEAILEGVQP